MILKVDYPLYLNNYNSDFFIIPESCFSKVSNNGLVISLMEFNSQ